MIMSHEKTKVVPVHQNLSSTSDLCCQPDCDTSTGFYMALM